MKETLCRFIPVMLFALIMLGFKSEVLVPKGIIQVQTKPYQKQIDSLQALINKEIDQQLKSSNKDQKNKITEARLMHRSMQINYQQRQLDSLNKKK